MDNNEKLNNELNFNHISNNQKEEVTLIPISDVLSHNDISIETLEKIQFFINNKYVNPYDYRVNIETGVFYNINNGEPLEIKKNPNTNQYEIYIENEQSQLDIKRQEKNKSKVRVLRPPVNNNRAAFTRISLLVINIIAFAILITTILIINK